MPQPQDAPATPALPAPPAPPLPALPGPPALPAGARTWSAYYEGLREQRRVLSEQLERLEERRASLSGRLQESAVVGADRQGLEARIASVDRQIADVERQIATAEAQLAQVAAVPGAIPREAPGPSDGFDPDLFGPLGAMLILFGVFPIALAYARRLWKRSAPPSPAPAALAPEMQERLSRLEHAVESVAVEVERISEGQRFVTRLLGESAGRGAPAGASRD